MAAFGWKFLNPSVHSVKSYLRFSAIILQHCQSSCPVSPWIGNGKQFSRLETPKILKTRNGEGKREAGRDPVTLMTFFRLIFSLFEGKKALNEFIHHPSLLGFLTGNQTVILICSLGDSSGRSNRVGSWMCSPLEQDVPGKVTWFFVSCPKSSSGLLSLAQQHKGKPGLSLKTCGLPQEFSQRSGLWKNPA